ncbi:MAG TPA: hypothetical protein VD997_15960 [Phycisphaerales bacterium]|nr:hypothetical protein [Phycisphaerales bacterium]
MRLALATLAASTLLLTGCKDKSPPANTTPAPQGSNTAPKHDHPHDDGHDHGKAAVELGSASIGPYTVRASREQGELKAGSDAPIDLWVTGDPAPAAVRFWIGSQDAAGSVKAKAEIEDAKDPTHWHTHAEVPDPLPAGAQLWVEIEDGKGVKHLGAFDLKR